MIRILQHARDVNRLLSRKAARFEAAEVGVRPILDAVRKRRRRPIEVDLSPISPPVIGDESGVIADRDLIERGFRRIRPEQRAIIVLHYYVGMPFSAVAETLDIPQGTAQSRLHPAMSDLRAAIAADEAAAGAVQGGVTA